VVRSPHIALVACLAIALGGGSAEARRRSKKKPKKKPRPVVHKDPDHGRTGKGGAGPDTEPVAGPDAGPPDASPTRRPSGKPDADKPPVHDFTGIQFEGRLRTPQLLYFLDRAAEELERASLERRSFLPELVRSIDEEGL
jgi:hypothetical protein